MIRLKLLSESELENVEHDGTPPTIEVRYGGQTRRAVLEQRPDDSRAYVHWKPVEIEP
jgi:hypothetical protein